MSQHSTLRSLCVSRIAPVIAALSFTIGAQHAEASPVEAAAIRAKLLQIPGFKTTGSPSTDILKAKSTDLIYAVALVLEDASAADGDADYSGLSAAAVVAEALSLQDGKARADKDKIAADLVSTAIASRGLSNSPTLAAQVVLGAFSVNPNTTAALKPTGKAAALAAGLKAVSQTDNSGGDAIGDLLGALPAAQQGDLSALLINTSKSLGKSAGLATTAFAGLAKSLLESGDVTNEVLTGAALSVASSVPAAAGALYGGLTQATNGINTDGAIKTLAENVVSNTKLAKAHGEILANITQTYGGDVADLTNALIAKNTKPTAQSLGLIAQGLISGRTAIHAGTVIGEMLQEPSLAKVSARVSFAGIVAASNGTDFENGDSSAIAQITSALVAGQTATDKININTAIVNGVSTTTPDAALEATRETLESGGVDAMTLATGSVAKIKVTAAAGAMAAAAVEATLVAAGDKVATAAQNSATIMAKGSKAATDIARNVAGLNDVSSSTISFAEKIADANKKFVINAAVGISIADTANTPAITLAAITHDVQLVNGKIGGDTAALAQTPKIAGAVATAVDVEQSSQLANTLSNAMSNVTNDVNKPIKISSLTAMATSIAKAIQSKAGIKTANRADELGELGAFLAANIIGKFGTDTKGLAAEAKAITSMGSALFKALSKKQLNDKRTLAADQDVWFDIVGSIALTIKSSTSAQLTAFLASGGILETAFAKLAGKAGTPLNDKIKNTIALVRDTNNAQYKFENGFVDLQVGETFEGVINDPETDKRDSTGLL